MTNSIAREGSIHDYIFEQMQDGVLLLDSHGKIEYVNPCAVRIFGLSDDAEDRVFLIESILQDESYNDDFHQFLLDAVYDKEHTHEGTVEYRLTDGRVRTLQIKTSFWKEPNDAEKNGILTIIQDITEKTRLQREKDDAILTLSLFIGVISGWVFIVEALEFFHLKIPSYALTYVLLAIGFFILLILRKKTSLDYSDFGLSFKNIGRVLVTDTIITAVLVVCMVIVKAIMLRLGTSYFPEGQPFWYFRVTSLGMLLYPISVVGQEFISRGVMHESLRKILTGKHREFYAILLSSLFFSALHIERGLPFMLGAVILLSSMGGVYLRQRTIWGLCIPHYVLTLTAIFLGFM